MLVNNRALNAVVARCIMDATFASRCVESDASALAVYRLNEAERSELTPALIGKIRSFAGFICKVQHNDLWESFPFTRALLRFYRLEHEIFCEYASIYQTQRSLPKSRAERRLDFIEFLITGFGEDRAARYAGVVDAALHERILEELRAAASDNGATLVKTPVHSGDRCDGIPIIRGLVRLGYFLCDPIAVTGMLRLGCFDTKTVSYCNSWRCYWLEPDNHEVHLVDVEPGIVMLLSAIDGRRTIDQVVAQASQVVESSRTSEWLLGLKALVNAGMLTLNAAGG